jgi:TatA/E family protein of Tat protein translocase
MLLALFNISEGEFLLIALVALLLFGSKGLPGLLRSLGRGIQQIRQASESVRREIQKSMLEAELELQRRRFELEQATQQNQEIRANPEAPEPGLTESPTKSNA